MLNSQLDAESRPTVHISRSQTIADLPAVQARDLMRRLRSSASIDEVSRIVGVEANRAHQLIELLVADGYLEPGAPRGGWWRTTKGSALADATLSKPIKRATAERYLTSVIERTKAFNANTGKPVTVARVLVFGSYLDPTCDKLGDLDLAVELVDRVAGREYEHRLLQIARLADRSLGSLDDQLFWPVEDLIRFLRDGKHAIHVVLDDITKITDRWRCVYRYDEDPDAEPIALSTPSRQVTTSQQEERPVPPLFPPVIQGSP